MYAKVLVQLQFNSSTINSRTGVCDFDISTSYNIPIPRQHKAVTGELLSEYYRMLLETADHESIR